MSLEVPIGKKNNIQIFYLNLQRHIHASKHDFKAIFDNSKGIDIQNVLSSNINTALDIVRDRPPFEINTVNHSSDLPSENFTFLHVLETYISIIEKITKPAPRFASNDNVLISDIVRRALSKHEDQNLLDVYLSKYHNAPKAKEKIYNYIYFIRRLPLIRYLLNVYIFHNRLDIFNLIHENRLDNVEYLLLKERGIKSRNFEDYFKSGVYRFESSEYLDSLAYYIDKSYTYENVFNNEFLYNMTGCRKKEYKIFNSMSLLSETTNNLDNVILLFPFLHSISELGAIQEIVLAATTKIIKDEDNGVVAHFNDFYIRDVEQVKFIITFANDRLTNSTMNFEIGNSIDRLDPIVSQILSLFAYDLVLQKIDVPDNLEDILILLSVFLVNMYNIFVKIEEKYVLNEVGLRERGFVKAKPLGENVNGLAITPEIARNNYITSTIVRANSNNLVDFYFFSAFFIFRNHNIRSLVKDSIFQLSHLFLATEFLKKNKHQASALFFFGALSDEKNKWVKSFNRDKNFFLNWALEYYDQIFKDYKTNIVE